MKNYHKSIPKGFRQLRLGEKLVFPYYGYNSSIDRYEIGDNKSIWLGTRKQRHWRSIIIKK